MNTLVFDIETIPDIESGKKLYDLSGSDAEIAEKMREIRRSETNGSDFMRHHLHKIIVISAVMDAGNKIKVWSLGEKDSSEKELITRFFEGIEKYSPTLVSWNGAGFDLPVLHYRALVNGVVAPRYWEMGEEDSSFKWNNYLNRYHYRHMDLMDILSCYQAKASARLDHIATMMDFPGKMGMDGSKVLDAYLNSEIESIRNYCETDVLNTYLVYLRFELMRGKLSASDFTKKTEQLRHVLASSHQPHLDEFLSAWQ
ncbi:MAG TPA: 3'-5' exonuclease [Gammaproteobacteria bacterium]|nr:3'-5' exonuclease [Gammaproteobacteria bacterium]